MPKRPKTPDYLDEPTKLLAIHRPYPPNANLEVRSDQGDFASWVCDMLGSNDYLLSFATKPRTPSVVLIEISKSFTDWRRLLGKHEWRDAFLHVDPADLDRHSAIFFSAFHNRRQAEKSGWKIKDLDEIWVRQNVHRPISRQPYPKTSHCNPPEGHVTDATLYRPIPLEYFPEIRINKGPVVGSGAWTSSRGEADALKRSQNGQRFLDKGDTKKIPGWAPAQSAASSSASSLDSQQLKYTRSNQNLNGRANRSTKTSSAGSRSPDKAESPQRQTLEVPDLVEDLAAFSIDPTATSTVETAMPSAWSTVSQTVKGPASVDTSIAADAEDGENLWAEEVDEDKKREFERYQEVIKCPSHNKICNFSMCSDYKPHLQRLGLTMDEIKAVGPHNIFTQQRKESIIRAALTTKEDDGFQLVGNGRRSKGGRGRNGRQNPAATKW